MNIDCDVHLGVDRHEDLFPYMSASWQRHFQRDEFLDAVRLSSDHVRVTERFDHGKSVANGPADHPPTVGLVIPHQALTVNGWADQVAALPYLGAINSYALEHWTSPTRYVALVISSHDLAWSAKEIRRSIFLPQLAAVALPLTSTMLGNQMWDPVYEAAVDANLPVIVHFSGVEGWYRSAPSLSGGVHHSNFSRRSLMPHLAESNITSLCFEGAFARFPDLRVIFLGFGFSWLPSLAWRIDREWRTFRPDMPWVTVPPSTWITRNMWFGSYPLGELARLENLARSTTAFRDRIVYGSHSPFGADSVDDLNRDLGSEWARAVASNGRNVLRLSDEAVI